MPERYPSPTADEVALVRALAEGVTDEAAAARLGWSTRTLRRRLRSAMDKLRASSRFQAGVQAERASWLREGETSRV